RMNGPVPSAALLRSPYFLTPASLTMKPQKPPSAATSAANGSLVTNFTAYLPAGSILSTALKSDLPAADFSSRRSNENFTSAEIKVPAFVWAAARRDSAKAPAVRPADFSSWRRVSWLMLVSSFQRASAGGAPAPRRPAARTASRRVRVEDVTEAIADQVERQHCDHDRDAREHRDPRRGLQIGPPLVQHIAPGRRRRLRGQPEIAQRRLDEDRLREGHGALHHERRQHVRQQMLERHHRPAGPQRPHRLDVFLLALGQHRPPHDASETRAP